jgi:hypothetical protein
VFRKKKSVGVSALCRRCASSSAVLGVRRVCEFSSGFELTVVCLGWVFSSVVRVCCGLCWCSGFSRCVQCFWFSRLGLANFAVVGGWFSSQFGRVGVSNPPPSPNGEV